MTCLSFFLGWSLYEGHQLCYASHYWVEAPVRIDRLDVECTTEAHRARPAHYVVRASYVYTTLEGMRREGQQFGFETGESPFVERLTERVNKVARRSPPRAFYDPIDPSRVVLERSFPAQFFCDLGFLFFAVGAGSVAVCVLRICKPRDLSLLRVTQPLLFGCFSLFILGCIATSWPLVFIDYWGAGEAFDVLMVVAFVIPTLVTLTTWRLFPSTAVTDAVTDIEYKSLPEKSHAVGVCQYCGDSLSTGAIVTCPKCATPHHRECWDENRGCTTYGCMG